MNGIIPVVRHLILCDDVRPRPDAPSRVDVFGMLTGVRVRAGSPRPLRHTFTAYVLLADARGSGVSRIVVVGADDESVVYQGAPHAVAFGNDPLVLQGVVIRVPECRFPAPGLYWVEFRYNEQVLAREPLRVREVP